MRVISWENRDDRERDDFREYLRALSEHTTSKFRFRECAHKGLRSGRQPTDREQRIIIPFRLNLLSYVRILLPFFLSLSRTISSAQRVEEEGRKADLRRPARSKPPVLPVSPGANPAGRMWVRRTAAAEPSAPTEEVLAPNDSRRSLVRRFSCLLLVPTILSPSFFLSLLLAFSSSLRSVRSPNRRMEEDSPYIQRCS